MKKVMKEEVKLRSEEKNKMKATVSFEKEGWDRMRLDESFIQQ